MNVSTKLRRVALAGAALAGALFGAGAFAATGGGATIHNAATLTYGSGTKVTDWVNVQVLTIGTAPEFALTSPSSVTANAGDTITLNYDVTSNANGNDNYSLSAASSVLSGLLPGSTFTLSTSTVALAASVTAAPSVGVDVDTGTVFIPAGSEANLLAGDIVVLNGNAYQVEAVRPGTIASTAGDVTTAEAYTQVDLTVIPASGAPVIGVNTIAAGVQLGERASFSLDVLLGTPVTPTVDGTIDVAISGSTSAPDTTGNPVSYDTSTDGDNTNDVTITINAADVTLTKEVRNVTKGGTFAVSGVTAQPGDVLEYRITMEVIPGQTDAANSVLTDEVPPYTTYVAASTTLNGAVVADDVGPQPFPLASANGGLPVNSANGAAGVLVDGDVGADAAVVIFQVTVQ